MNRIRAEVRISGRVQGVNFRYHTEQTARRNNVTGWVKNLPDGDVAAVFEGAEDNVMHVVDWCRSGPSPAKVDDLQVDRKEYTGEFSSFEIRH